MKLSYDKNSKDPTYFIQQGIRNGKKTTTKNVYRIGKHSELLKITDDPLAYAKQKVAEFNEEYEKGKVGVNLNIDYDEKLTYTGDTASQSTVLNIGYFILQKIYNDLEIESFLDGIYEDKKAEYKYNDINRFLTYSRVLYPGSKLYTVNHLDTYYEKPSFSHQHVLRFMDVLSAHYDKYIEHLFDKSSNIVPRNTSVCYYDCSNFYCESESNDKSFINKATGEVIDGLRMYGTSKEGRPNPIVEMGLFMDADGIPLSMCICPGNTNEQTTAIPLEKQLVKMFKNKKFIYCADGGINSYNIRLYNSFSDRAFVVTQSLKKVSKTIQDAVLSDCDYRLLSNNRPFSLDAMKSFDKEDEKYADLYHNDCIYKIISADKCVDLGIVEEKVYKNGKTGFVKSKGSLQQKVIVTYSRLSAEYQKHIREGQIERARNIINNYNVEDVKKGPNDVTRFIKRISQGKNGEKAIDHYEIDQDKIDQESMFDGFYALATNLEGESDYDLAKNVIKINSGRYKIEDCFRLIKSGFDGRPIYHRRPERIKAHFLICYTALLIFRLLEAKLNRNGTHFSPDNIIETLRNMGVTNMQDLFYSSTYTSSEVCTAFNAIFNLGLDKKYYKPKDLNKKLRKNL